MNMVNYNIKCKCGNVFKAPYFGNRYQCKGCGRTVYTNSTEREKHFFLGVA